MALIKVSSIFLVFIMQWDIETTAKKYDQPTRIIDLWLKSRQRLLASYYNALTLLPFIEPSQDDKQQLADFCNQLSEYIATGHFDIFANVSQVISAGIIDQPTKQTLLRTTLNLMSFNNKHRFANDNISLRDDLSKLGEELSTRMELEDKLINNYLRLTKL